MVLAAARAVDQSHLLGERMHDEDQRDHRAERRHELEARRLQEVGVDGQLRRSPRLVGDRRKCRARRSRASHRDRQRQWQPFERDG